MKDVRLCKDFYKDFDLIETTDERSDEPNTRIFYIRKFGRCDNILDENDLDIIRNIKYNSENAEFVPSGFQFFSSKNRKGKTSYFAKVYVNVR